MARAWGAAQVVIVWLGMGTIAWSQQTGDGVALPQNPAQWVNSAPIPSQALEGKAALLYFYEEGCPRCRERWPQIMSAAKEFEGKPIVFIAVNSGTPRGAVEQYARSVGLRWPVIVDPTREFEKASGVNEISLQNIYQVKLVTGDGKLVSGSAQDIKGSAERALAGAKWNVDPAGIPQSMFAAWRAIEFGNFPAGAAAVNKGLKSGSDEIKTAATRLNDYVTFEMRTLLDAAAASSDAWGKYKNYAQIRERFAGFETPAEVAIGLKELAADDGVKRQLAAYRQLELIKKGANTTSPVARAGVIGRLKKFIESNSGADAAQEAQTLLAQLGG